MERLRKYISIQLAFAILVFAVCTCYMSVPVKAIGIDDAYQTIGDLIEIIGADREITPEIVRKAFYQCITHDMGFITADMTVQEAEWLRKGWANILNNLYGGNDKTKDNLTSEDYERLAQYITQNVTLNEGDRSITYNDNAKNAFNICINERINECGYYYNYSADILLNLNYFSDATFYQELRRKVSEYQDDYYILFYPHQSEASITLFKKDRNVVQVLSSHWSAPYIDMGGMYLADTWETYNNPDLGFVWNTSSETFNQFTPSSRARYGLTFTIEDYIFNGINSTPNFILITNNKTSVIKVYKTLNDLKAGSVGVQPYYFNNRVYNNYKNSVGNYTVNTDNSNHATYGDVNSYIDNSTTNNGYPPDTDQINIYIENVPAVTPTPTPTPTPNPDNPSGDGSGSSVSGNSGGSASATATANGGTASANNEGINITINNNHNINLGGGSGLSGNTVSGNGSGSSGGIGGIFDFLSQIGDFIGSLIKNIGNVLADIVTGIGSVVSSLLEVIPTVFNDFLGGVLGWLPPELRALVTLSISAMIIVGLIKLFRG